MKHLVWLVPMSLLLAWAWHERQAVADFPGILSAYSAKEYCSCRFVMGFDAAYCQGYVKQYLPLGRLEEDPARRRVFAEGLGRSSVAAWQGARAGCRLLP
ncbi:MULTISPECIES: amidase [Pseudomonas]|uniref:amidase n=1 Tax=Pseudomonas guariconensis TaxID=1288410 RepID=UPI00209712AA|nr:MULTISPECIES: amidase [Pseudomonas]MCO7595172.1 amidase [Pseudomonas guariconensis]MCU7220948.1 amidase [Pseudomonas brassicacearum]